MIKVFPITRQIDKWSALDVTPTWITNLNQIIPISTVIIRDSIKWIPRHQPIGWYVIRNLRTEVQPQRNRQTIWSVAFSLFSVFDAADGEAMLNRLS